MSYDLLVVTHHEPTLQHVRHAVSHMDGLRPAANVDARTWPLVIETCTNGKTRPPFIVERPEKVEVEDLDDAVAQAILAPRWSTLISVPAGLELEGIVQGKRLAQMVADACLGIVVDPQAERVIWPRGHARYRGSQIDERMTVVRVMWVFPLATFSTTTLRAWNDIAKRRIPGIEIAGRYGDAHPLQNRIPGSAVEAFHDFCAREVADESRATVYWATHRPCIQGEVVVNQPTVPGAKNGVAAWSITISFEGVALEDAEQWREAVMSTFVGVASRLRATYGAVWLNRRTIVTRQGLGFDQETEDLRIPTWNGIPSFPVWASWFGDPYREAVEESLRGCPVESSPGGLYLRLSEKPLNRDDLTSIFPTLPANLLQNSRWIVRQDPNLTWFEKEIAPTIPDLG